MQATVDNALAVREEHTNELAPTTQEALAQHEIQSAIIIARKFPRNEDECFAKVMRACKRTSFAQDVTYSYPRGGSQVEGPSIYFAREFARCWGNIRHGCYIVNDDDSVRTIRAWAWDVETNTKSEAEDTFKKLVQRKRNGVTQWVEPDERDLRELTNKRGAIAKRNCLLELFPSDLVEQCIAQSKATLKDQVAKDPDAARRQIVLAFDELNIKVDQLETYLGHPLGQATPAEIANLRGVYKSLRDGNTTWSDYVGGPAKGEAGKARSADIMAKAGVGPTPDKPPADAPPPAPAGIPVMSPDNPEDNQSREIERADAIDGIRERLSMASGPEALAEVKADIMRAAPLLGEDAVRTLGEEAAKREAELAPKTAAKAGGKKGSMF